MPKINPLIAIGLPTWGRVTVNWSLSFRSLGGPLGSSMTTIPVEGKPIAEARNQIMSQAIAAGADFVFFVGDDVLMPGDAMTRLLARMWDEPTLHLATGVYWTKAWPTEPYLWRGMQRGPYRDWKLGEWFPVDYAGCDCLLVRLSPEIKSLGPDWFSTQWLWTTEQERPSDLATEDFYFYTKARKLGLKLWCDSGVQCLHEDRGSGAVFGLAEGMPQAGGIPPVLPDPGTGAAKTIVADIGCGLSAPYFGEPAAVEVWRFDIDEKTQPTHRCDVRRLPVPDQSVDVIHSRHVLEHFERSEAPRLLREWTRILRVGGEVRICVPNLLTALRAVLHAEEHAPPGQADPYPWWQLYGQQKDQYDRHFNGFTPRRLKKLLELVGTLGEIEVRAGDEDEINLYATARKVRHDAPMSLTDEWAEIERAEGFAMLGLAGDAPAPQDDRAPAPVVVEAVAVGAGVPAVNGHKADVEIGPLGEAMPVGLI